MSKKLNQSLVVDRQIPEFIGTQYPLFVEFIKAYYEFLQQSQQKNLEGYRDIDTTLDEFLTRFKSELSENIPVELAKDKRSLLRHIREFYLSRGSEASYKFLFKVLFDKDATLFYPSTQMLRVSDGKWNQETSIFVKTNNPDQTLFAMSGQFVKINASGRVFETYVSNVVEYKSDIYELSILNNPINDFIGIGSTVSFIQGDERYIGKVLKTPTKISIYKKGKGFKLGDIFSLKTDLGAGCIVKVTKVDSDGGILAVSVIKFGLDYETRFWSYLAPGQLESFEYVQPTKLWENAVYTPSNIITNVSSVAVSGSNKFKITITTQAAHNLSKGQKITVGITSLHSEVNGTFVISETNTTNTFSYIISKSGLSAFTTTSTSGLVTKPYEESSGGFTEYGYATKQTYMEYDMSIPVGSGLGKESDRFYADGSYVGEIQNQFYSDQSSQDLTLDYAVIQVDVGAVAKYPGYYGSADGFVSDNVYIQDGYYYQTYSYVLRVEEEFKKYSSLVKSIVHPAGMKLFAEYNISNIIDLAFLEPATKNVLQFSNPISNIIDQGYEYTTYENSILQSGDEYITTLNIDGTTQQKPRTIVSSPAPGSAIAISLVGKNSLRAKKPLLETLSFTQTVGKQASSAIKTAFLEAVALNPNYVHPSFDSLDNYYLEKNNQRDLTYVTASDLTFVHGTGIIQSTTTDLSIFRPPQAGEAQSTVYITISGCYNLSNNGTYTILQYNNANEIVVAGKLFDGEVVSALTNGVSGNLNPLYKVTIRLSDAPFNDYEFASSSGYGYSSYSDSISLPSGSVSSTPNITNKVYTRNVTSTYIPVVNSYLWNSEPIDIYHESGYASHSAYYMSINSAARTSFNVTSYVSTGVKSIRAYTAQASSFMAGDIVRITGAGNSTTTTAQNNLNGVWEITSTDATSIYFETYSILPAGTYDSLLGTAYTWRPNPYFTKESVSASSGFGYVTHILSIDSIGNTSSTQDTSSNKVYTRTTTSTLHSVGEYDVSVSVDPTSYANYSAYHMELNKYPRTTLPITGYNTNGTTSVTATLSSASGVLVGDLVRISGTNTGNVYGLRGTWYVTGVSGLTFTFNVTSPMSTATYSSGIGTAVTWRPHSKFTDNQSNESVGFAYTAYTDVVGTTSTNELAYSGTVETDSGTKSVNVYVSTSGGVGAQRVYSGASTATTLTDSSNNTYINISGNTASTTVLPHSSQRLNKVKVDSVPHVEEGRIVKNAYNEEAEWLGGYFSIHTMTNGQYDVQFTDYQSYSPIPT